jgi:hypothetical protein
VPTDHACYVWNRLHVCALHYFRKASPRDVDKVPRPPGTPTQPRGRSALPAIELQPEEANGRRTQETLRLQWLMRLRCSSRSLVASLSGSVFPLEPVATLCSSPDQQSALSATWALISDSIAADRQGDALSATPTSGVGGQDGKIASTDLIGIWPLPHETTAMGASGTASEPARCTRQLGSATELFVRKGECVRAVCVNALNNCQLAVSLADGVHQLELADSSIRGSDATQDRALGVSVQQSSDFKASCLCAHPKVRCWLDAFSPACLLPRAPRGNAARLLPCCCLIDVLPT